MTGHANFPSVTPRHSLTLLTLLLGILRAVTGKLDVFSSHTLIVLKESGTLDKADCV